MSMSYTHAELVYIVSDFCCIHMYDSDLNI